MSDSLEQFSSLSLSPSVSPSELDQRISIVRDVLSCFHRDIFPSQFRVDLYQNIIQSTEHRPLSERTLPGDLEGSLLYWGCYDDTCFEFLKKCQPPAQRARLFSEKLGRHFDSQFTKYDHLARAVTEDTAQSIAVSMIRETVLSIQEDIHNLLEIAQIDLNERSEKREGTARVLLNALGKICERHDDVLRSRKNEPSITSSNITGTNLCDMLIRAPETQPTIFMVEALEKMSNSTLATLTQELKKVEALLRQRSAPSAYCSRVSAISARANMTTAMSQPQSAGGRSGESRAGSKRSGGESTTARGKRRT